MWQFLRRANKKWSHTQPFHPVECICQCTTAHTGCPPPPPPSPKHLSMYNWLHMLGAPASIILSMYDCTYRVPPRAFINVQLCILDVPLPTPTPPPAPMAPTPPPRAFVNVQLCILHVSLDNCTTVHTGCSPQAFVNVWRHILDVSPHPTPSSICQSTTAHTGCSPQAFVSVQLRILGAPLKHLSVYNCAYWVLPSSICQCTTVHTGCRPEGSALKRYQNSIPWDNIVTLFPYRSIMWAAFRTRSLACSISRRDCATSAWIVPWAASGLPNAVLVIVCLGGETTK